jgi:hypothetical protein
MDFYFSHLFIFPFFYGFFLSFFLLKCFSHHFPDHFEFELMQDFCGVLGESVFCPDVKP